MSILLQSLFVNASVYVYSDLLAAARSLLNNKDGNIAILGTGSNVAYYKNKIVYPFMMSTGYLIGDEGSGNSLGKRFLKSYFNGDFDIEITHKVGQNKQKILNELYNHPMPNRYLASFAKIIFENKNHPQISELIKLNFEEWIENCLLPFGIKNISLCGSISFYFSSELKKCCDNYQIKIMKVIEKPIDDLVLFHKNYD